MKGHNSGANTRKMMCNNPKLDLVNINAYIKFGGILSIYSQDIERERNSGVNQGPLYYSGLNVRVIIMCNNRKLDHVSMNAYLKIGEILSICSQEILV